MQDNEIPELLWWLYDVRRAAALAQHDAEPSSPLLAGCASEGLP